MKLEPFVMERWQSTWENLVEYNLSESSVHPMRLEELLPQGESVERFMKTLLAYTQSNGTIELREVLTGLYPGSTIENIQVTNGSSEANFVCTWSLLEPGDEVVLMLPNYMQIWGIVRAFGGAIKPFHLRETDGWAPDMDELRRAVNSRTRMIAVCNPNNPTGAILSDSEIREICEIAASAGAWVLADEVYLGSERSGRTSTSFWGQYERVIVTHGLSKAYGLPGLRIGWIAAPAQLLRRTWMHHDYTTISPGALSDALAQVALAPGRREQILERTRNICRQNYPILAKWVADHGDMFRMIAPKAGAITYLKYQLPVNSTALVERIRQEKSVLVVAGDHFGMDNYLRIGYGPEPEYLKEGLNRIDEVLQTLSRED
jgi:aspartate/methionine/tyrosine aminotransferase